MLKTFYKMNKVKFSKNRRRFARRSKNSRCKENRATKQLKVLYNRKKTGNILYEEKTNRIINTEGETVTFSLPTIDKIVSYSEKEVRSFYATNVIRAFNMRFKAEYGNPAFKVLKIKTAIEQLIK